MKVLRNLDNEWVVVLDRKKHMDKKYVLSQVIKLKSLPKHELSDHHVKTYCIIYSMQIRIVNMHARFILMSLNI